MSIRNLTLAVLVVVAALCAGGCGKTKSAPVAKPLTPEQAALVKKYEALPESTKIALGASNLFGMTVANVGKSAQSGIVFGKLLEEGATRASSDKASLVVNEKRNAMGDATEINITDSMGNTIPIPLKESLSPPNLPAITHDIANSLGAERKAAMVNQSAPPARD